ncbi:S8 family serine peptidase [Flavobacterium sp. LHD-85]|uniref:S8 family serine peptidase n=1 Tax=Flavobacterium sp. LHD-85 TaxID=3071410 RepID=UPI0027DFA6E3|nr:S8 family serine peptidase [Flavobacterium sp. LHD-85]MDQ6531271.1 S8 family serine peptidase [Flavobacterium sp. LHD-85]
MRNWHHKVIKLDRARDLLLSKYINKYGYSNVYIGVIEGQIEFQATNSSNPLTINDYTPAHGSFSDISGNRKVFTRSSVISTDPKYNKQFTQNISTLSPSMHTTCVTGIISGNEDSSTLIDGISPNIRVINSNNFEDGLFLALINPFSNNNILSPFFASAKDNDFINGGASNTSDSYSNNFTSVINCSFNIPLTSTKVDFILKELFAYGRNGRGTLVVVSAGNGDDSTGRGLEISETVTDSGYRTTAFSNKSLIVAASKVILDSNDLPSYINNPVFDESKADYSNYGKRVDLCAPSGPDSNPSKDDINIYSPTMLNCGNIGTDKQSFFTKINQVVSNTKLILENVKGIFKGQSIELGDSNSYFHELRYINKVDKITGTNNVEVTLDTPIKFTKDFNKNGVQFSLVGTNARIVALKKNATKHTGSNYQLTLKDLRGINLRTGSQKVYIYPKNSELTGIDTEITTIVDENTYRIEVRDNLSALPNDPINNPLILVPDQIKASIKCINYYKNTKPTSPYYSVTSVNDIAGFFVGQEVLLSGGTNRIAFITKIDGTTITMSHSPSPIDDKLTMTSLAYGDFTSRFTGTSAATPIVSGLAGLILSANNDLNAAEIKHILKETTDKITGASNYSLVNNDTKYNYSYTTNDRFGTGRINAEAAVQLAIDWHTSTTVQKPKMEIADRLNGLILESVLETEPVDSPDIWIKSLADNTTQEPSPTQLFNNPNTSVDQKIYIKVRNSGNKASFKECDLRVYIAFTDDENPAFPFPSKWYDQADVKLLAVKEIPIIQGGSSTTIGIEWKDIASKWNMWNNLDTATTKRKNAYLLAHIAPFDGNSNEVRNTNIRFNKQLSCKPIIVSHNSVTDGSAFLPGKKLDLTVGAQSVQKKFHLLMENVLTTNLSSFKIRARTTKNNSNKTVEEVFYEKTGNTWSLQPSPTDNWIAFDQPIETPGNHPEYTNIKFPHTINVDNTKLEVKLEIVNI